MERRFRRALDVLDEIHGFVDEFFDGDAIAERDLFAVKFAIEEIFTNIVKYGSPGEREVEVGLEREANRVRIAVTDLDADPFDPTAAGDVDVDASLEARKVGGLGLHLTRRVVDEMTYEYRDRRSTVRMTKTLG